MTLHQGWLSNESWSDALHRSMLILVQNRCCLHILLNVVLVSGLQQELSDLRICHWRRFFVTSCSVWLGVLNSRIAHSTSRGVHRVCNLRVVICKSIVLVKLEGIFFRCWLTSWDMHFLNFWCVNMSTELSRVETLMAWVDLWCANYSRALVDLLRSWFTASLRRGWLSLSWISRFSHIVMLLVLVLERGVIHAVANLSSGLWLTLSSALQNDPRGVALVAWMLHC